ILPEPVVLMLAEQTIVAAHSRSGLVEKLRIQIAVDQTVEGPGGIFQSDVRTARGVDNPREQTEIAERNEPLEVHLPTRKKVVRAVLSDVAEIDAKFEGVIAMNPSQVVPVTGGSRLATLVIRR